jgi:transcriptional regulator GlxA family with amidase domain
MRRGIGKLVALDHHIRRRVHGSTTANALARRMVVAAHRDGGQALQACEQPDMLREQVLAACE